MTDSLPFLAYVLILAFAPLVYSSVKTISFTKLSDVTFVKTLVKAYLRTLPVCAAVCLPVLLLPAIVRPYALALHLVFAPLCLLELGHVRLFGTRIGLNTFYSLFVSNVRETKEYLQQNVPAIQIILTLAVWLLPLWPLAHLPVPAFDTPWLRWVALAADLALAAPFFRLLFQAPADRKDGYVMNPFFSIFHHYALYRRNYRELQKLIRAHAAPAFGDIRSTLPSGTEETYVIVIGESANAQHFGCYGYPRATNEFTDRLGDELLRVPGVRSPFAQTIPSLEKVLTFADADHPDWVFAKGSVIDYFNEAGFRTYWYSNQYALDDTALTAMTSHASLSKCFNFSGMKHFEKAGLDGDLLPDFRKLVANGEPRKVIFLHLIGSHSAYVNRYPDAFHHFEGQAPGRSLSPDKLKMLNPYDDSIRYTDWVLSEIIAATKARGGAAYVLYFSDHGEDIYDSTDDRILGHSQLANLPMTSVPLMLWTSPDYNRLRPDIRTAVPKRGYDLTDLIHTVIDLSSLRGPEFDPTKSVFTNRGPSAPAPTARDASRC